MWESSGALERNVPKELIKSLQHYALLPASQSILLFSETLCEHEGAQLGSVSRWTVTRSHKRINDCGDGLSLDPIKASRPQP